MSIVVRRILLLLILTALTACASGRAQQPLTRSLEPVAAPTPVVAPQPEKQSPPPVLWEVSGPRGTSYLFGTMHFGVSAEDLPGEVLDAMSHSKVFVLESDPTTADPRDLADMMMLPPGPSLAEQLGPERWNALRELLGNQFEEHVARRLQPWVLEAVVIQTLLPKENPMDVALLDLARERRMQVDFLEQWTTQVETLNAVSTTDSLAEIVDDPARFRKRALTMTRDYLAGDIAALENHVFAPPKADASLGHNPFAPRNASWLPRLSELLERGDTFVAVGVGHLLGPEGVLVMLERSGYVVRRVGQNR